MNSSTVAPHTTEFDLVGGTRPAPISIQPLAYDRPRRGDPQCRQASRECTLELGPVRKAARLEHHKLSLPAVREAGLDGRLRSERSRCHATL